MEISKHDESTRKKINDEKNEYYIFFGLRLGAVSQIDGFEEVEETLIIDLLGDDSGLSGLLVFLFLKPC